MPYAKWTLNITNIKHEIKSNSKEIVWYTLYIYFIRQHIAPGFSYTDVEDNMMKWHIVSRGFTNQLGTVLH